MQRIIALACTALLAFGTARADTTLVVSMAAIPLMWLLARRNAEQYLRLCHGDDL